MSDQSVVILEDHPLLAGITREVVQGLLPDCEVFIVNSMQQLLADRPPAKFLIIDLHLDDANDREVLQSVREIYPNSSGLVYTSQSSAEALAKEFGYTFLDKRVDSATFFDTLAKAFEACELSVAIETDGHSPSDKRYSHQSTIIAPGAAKPLTHKQVEVMECCCRGLSAKETARELDLGVETIRAHMSEIFLRLQVKNAPQAVEVYSKAKRLAAVKSGLFTQKAPNDNPSENT